MSSSNIAMRDALLSAIHREMAGDDSIFFLSADFGSPVIDRISADYSERFINVGIAEQNLINVATGLALEGFKVFAYAIAPFITMRCYEQIRVNLALLSSVRSMNVTLIGVGAGYSYTVSGPTHQCYEDLSIMRTLPGVQVYSPADSSMAAALLLPCLEQNGVKYLRLDAQPLPPLYPENDVPEITHGYIEHRRGSAVCLVATGYMLHVALAVAEELSGEGIDAGVVDLFDLTAPDQNRLCGLLAAYPVVVSIEEGLSGRGGMDALLLNLIAAEQLMLRYVNCGIEGGYRFELGSRDELHESAGIGRHALLKKIRQLVTVEQEVSNDV